MQVINSLLNHITMYRLMLYFLILLVGVATVESALGILPYNPAEILFGVLYLAAICWLSNKILAAIFRVKTNPESAFITGLILSLIIGPANWIPAFAGMASNLLFLPAAGALAMVSKYLIAWKGRHIFNPAAFGVVGTAILLQQGASWWIGSPSMFPVLFLGGLLILRKLRRFTEVIVFIISMILIRFILNPFLTLSVFSVPTLFELTQYLVVSPIVFFAAIMLIEPQTSPLQSKYQILYAIIVAIFFYIFGNNLGVPYPLELALLGGNIFSYMVSKSFRQVMVLKEKKRLTEDVIAFLFEPSRKFQFKAGQFLEWTLAHPNPDNRGVRRFFTISSSPAEDFVMLTSKFYEKPSTYKQALQKLEPGDEIVISGLGGEFTMPSDKSKKLVFIAGGIGVTPFRSMVKWIIDNNEKRDVVILYSNKTEGDIVFKEIFEKGEKVGVSTIYVNTDKDGYIDAEMIRNQVSDYRERMFYIAGPESMVEAFEGMLKGMGVAGIKKDYFPGYTETHQN